MTPLSFLISFVIAALIWLSVSLLLRVFDGCLAITFKNLRIPCITTNFEGVDVYVDCTLKPKDISLIYLPVCFFSKEELKKRISKIINLNTRRVVLKNSTDFVLTERSELAKKIEHLVICDVSLSDKFSVENLSISNVEKC